jgi:hypothetical protein
MRERTGTAVHYSCDRVTRLIKFRLPTKNRQIFPRENLKPNGSDLHIPAVLRDGRTFSIFAWESQQEAKV